MPTPTAARARWLLAARLVGVWGLGVIAQIAVEMPGGFFGRADVMTRFGAVYAALLTAVVALLALAPTRHRWPARTAPLLLATNVGLFLPALASDPVVAGSVLLWNLLLLAQQLFPAAHATPHPGPATPAREWVARYGAALRHLTATALLLTVAVVGYRLSDHALTRGICLLLDAGTLALAWPLLRRLARAGQRAVWLLAPPLATCALSAVVLGPEATPWVLACLATALLVLLLLLLAQQSSTLELLRDFYRRPSWLIFASFAAVILVGTVLLTFPAAAGAQPISPLDALFTATSATCVTGLIVLDTPTDLSLLGQGIVLALIQLGGLGIMVVSTFATLMLGGSLGLRGEQALSEMMDQAAASTAYRLTRFIVLSTLAVEAVGAVVLAVLFAAHGHAPAAALWRGVFHAVSAFCNAGFALQSDSLVGLSEVPGAVLAFAVLIVLGGLGFAVLATLWTRLGHAVGRRRDDDRRRPLDNQVKVVLAVSALLLAAGTVLFAALEWRRSLAGLPVADRMLHALFQSVTLRTAGFNSVDLSLLAPASLVFMMLFMFIGASPGSTGGGIKTTTLAVLLATLRGAVGDEPPRLFNREIPRSIVLRSLAILLLSAALVLLGLFVLLLFEDHDFLPLLFEVVSAFGTVGLSLGVTAELGPLGKLLIVAVMFVGRIGPLTLALLLGTGARRRAVLRYPESRLMVG